MSKIESFIKENIDFKSDEPFTVFNVEDVILKHKKWLELLPRVIPYYAFKANRFPLLLDVMIGLGLRFDCASPFEMNELLKRGAKPEDIIFANPCKTNTFLKYAKNNGIDLMTFDNEEELNKIEAIYPEARLVLRIKVDDSLSNTRLSEKFGTDLKDVEHLLQRAKELGLNVMGIAFHVGSGCSSSQSYAEAIRVSRIAFDVAIGLGFNMTLLDIGGGFPGSDNIFFKHKSEILSSFEEMSEQINDSLSHYFPEENLTIIGEPGRYYVVSAFTSMTKIITKKIVDSNDEKRVEYYLNDGFLGSFSFAACENQVFKPVPIRTDTFFRKVYQSTLWGPTCSSHDVIRANFKMPEMNIGEWILFENMGAYLMNYSEFGFNGMPSPTVKVFVSDLAQKVLMQIKNWSKIESYLDVMNERNIKCVDF